MLKEGASFGKIQISQKQKTIYPNIGMVLFRAPVFCVPETDDAYELSCRPKLYTVHNTQTSHAAAGRASSFKAHNETEKLLVVNVYPSVLIGIETSEGIRQTLKLDAQLDEIVEENHSFTCGDENEYMPWESHSPLGFV